MTSCYKDDSATDFKIINPIKVDLGGMTPSVTAFQFDDLVIKPIVYRNGIKDDNLDCEWSVQGNNHPITVVCNKMTLNFNVTMPPNSDAYDLILTVTDKTTGIQAREKFMLKVVSKYSEGLFVADTKDEKTSDISLLISMNFSRSVTDETAKSFRDMYSARNNTKIDGLITRMQSLIKSDSRTLAILTDHSIYRIDPYDFGEWQRDNEIFYVPYETMKPVDICKIDYMGTEYINVDGKIFFRNSSWANYYFNYYMMTFDLSDCSISKFTTLGNGYYAKKPYCYDEKNNRFVMVSDRNDMISLFKEQDPSLPFDVNRIEPSDALSMTEGENESLVAVLKTETGNKYHIYWMQTKIADNGSNLPLAKIDISNFTDINNAIGFTSSPLSKDFYYATDKKIYSFPLDNPNLGGQVKFEIDPLNSDEKITSMMMWRGEYQGIWYADKNQTTGFSRMNAKSRMIVITTYNETTKEGKVITMPIIRLGDGTIDTDRKTHVEYGGFGRITSIEYNQVGG